MAKKISAVKAAPKRPSKARAKKKTIPLSIDYPQDGEAVRAGHYSIRLTAPGSTSAQVRFDGGNWTDCREAVGHYWFDWSAAAGHSVIEARARSGKGRWAAAAQRTVAVADAWATN